MKYYISHYSALKYWNVPYLEGVIPIEILESGVTDITFFEPSKRFISQKYNVHVKGMALHKGSILYNGGKSVASPELTFLQLAGKLSIQRLVLLGLQLCSHPPGEPSKAVTSRQKLIAFLDKTSRHHGHRKALRAVKYIENGSASIMESLSYMILTLPNALGGYGIKGAVFNHEIKLTTDGADRLGQKRCFADLYYKSKKLAVEYDSFTFHNSPFEQGKDNIRAAILEKQGIDIMRLSTIQLYNIDACRDFATNLSTRLKSKIEIRTEKFYDMHNSLRALMPKKEQI